MISLPAGQQVQVTVGLPADTVRIVNRHSGKVLDVNGASTADGAAIIQWPWTGATNQQWRLTPNYDGSFRLTGVHGGKVLDSPGGSSEGAGLIQWTDNSSINQRWQLVPAATSGYYRLVNRRNGWCIDVENGSTADGARVIQWPANGGANQEWQIVGL